MSNSDRTSLDDILQRAQTLPPDQRLQFVREACQSDEGLFADAITRMSGFAADYEEGADSSGDEAQAQREELVGQVIGPYRLVRSLGSGGMGEVFLADRADAQFHQQVAIKLVRQGLLSRHVRGRLRLERQILATLNHPNIARLLDGGTLEDGTPYIVMEYVDGEPIDSYCDRCNLTIEKRLELFLTICSAVHRAHQNLIVHRDLKPSNILVANDGTVKLLDFGIAKLLDSRQMMHTMAVTHADYRLMTPDHASPEQVRGDPITTASDIYVLGVLLYELLTGFRPFAVKGTSFAALEQAICEKEPVLPSSAIASSPMLSVAEQAARQRSTTVSKLARALRGDLDNIISMAMRKEPERRYSSVEQFAADIQRYLTGMPVIARADSWTYRADKFIRRHAVSVAASLVFVLVLIGFAATTYVQAKRIEEERDLAAMQRARAEAASERSAAVTSFLIGLFQQSDPSEARGNQVTAREILDKGASRIGMELQDQPELHAAMLNTIGRVYFSLGLSAEALPMIERGLQVRRARGDPISIADSLLSLDEVLLERGEVARAEAAAREALEIYRRDKGTASLEVGDSLCHLGIIQQRKGDLALAESSLQKCLEIYRQNLDEDDAKLTLPLDNLARVLSLRKNYDSAEQLYRAAVEIVLRTRGDNSPEHARLLNNLATTLHGKGDLQAAEKMFTQALELQKRVNGPSHWETIDVMSNLARLFRDQGKYDEAHAMYEDVLQKDKEVRGSRHRMVGLDLHRLANLAMTRGHFSEAERLYRDALEIYKETLPHDDPYSAYALMELGRVLIYAGRASEAQTLLERAIAATESVYGKQSYEHALARATIAYAWAAQGQGARAEPILAASYDRMIAQTGMNDRNAMLVQTWLQSVRSSE
jgi:serine/threonine protein kinase/tetratricopeptide (TPR) repeat protein